MAFGRVVPRRVVAPSRPAQRATGEKKERPSLFQKCGKPDHRHYGSVSFRCRSATLGLRQAQRTRPSIGPTAAAWHAWMRAWAGCSQPKLEFALR